MRGVFCSALARFARSVELLCSQISLFAGNAPVLPPRAFAPLVELAIGAVSRIAEVTVPDLFARCGVAQEDCDVCADVPWGPCSLSARCLSLIHISEPTRLGMISYAVF